MVRIAVNGIECIQQTWDDAFNWDGVADEIYLTWSVSVVTAGAGVPNVGQSGVYGDINNQPGRIQAGSATNKGGIKTGDVIPTMRMGKPPLPPGLPPGIPIPLFPQPAWSSIPKDGFPMTIWDGDIGPNTIVSVVPLVNEFDGGIVDPGPAIKVGNKVAMAVAGAVAVAVPVVGLVAAIVGPIVEGIANSIGTAGNRPIGRRLNDNDNITEAAWQVVSLNSQSAGAAATQDNGYGPGVYRLVQTDPADIGAGAYALYVQVSVV